MLHSRVRENAVFLRDITWIVVGNLDKLFDKEHCTALEDIIILAPNHIRFVFLSNPIPNAKKFVSWVSSVRGGVCQSINQWLRAIPQRQFVYPVGWNEVFCVFNESEQVCYLLNILLEELLNCISC